MKVVLLLSILLILGQVASKQFTCKNTVDYWSDTTRWGGSLPTPSDSVSFVGTCSCMVNGNYQVNDITVISTVPLVSTDNGSVDAANITFNYGSTMMNVTLRASSNIFITASTTDYLRNLVLLNGAQLINNQNSVASINGFNTVTWTSSSTGTFINYGTLQINVPIFSMNLSFIQYGSMNIAPSYTFQTLWPVTFMDSSVINMGLNSLLVLQAANNSVGGTAHGGIISVLTQANTTFQAGFQSTGSVFTQNPSVFNTPLSIAELTIAPSTTVFIKGSSVLEIGILRSIRVKSIISDLGTSISAGTLILGMGGTLDMVNTTLNVLNVFQGKCRSAERALLYLYNSTILLSGAHATFSPCGVDPSEDMWLVVANGYGAFVVENSVVEILDGTRVEFDNSISGVKFYGGSIILQQNAYFQFGGDSTLDSTSVQLQLGSHFAITGSTTPATTSLLGSTSFNGTGTFHHQSPTYLFIANTVSWNLAFSKFSGTLINVQGPFTFYGRVDLIGYVAADNGVHFEDLYIRSYAIFRNRTTSSTEISADKVVLADYLTLETVNMTVKTFQGICLPYTGRSRRVTVFVNCYLSVQDASFEGATCPFVADKRQSAGGGGYYFENLNVAPSVSLTVTSVKVGNMKVGDAATVKFDGVPVVASNSLLSIGHVAIVTLSPSTTGTGIGENVTVVGKGTLDLTGYVSFIAWGTIGNAFKFNAYQLRLSNGRFTVAGSFQSEGLVVILKSASLVVSGPLETRELKFSSPSTLLSTASPRPTVTAGTVHFSEAATSTLDGVNLVITNTTTFDLKPNSIFELANSASIRIANTGRFAFTTNAFISMFNFTQRNGLCSFINEGSMTIDHFAIISIQSTFINSGLITIKDTAKLIISSTSPDTYLALAGSLRVGKFAGLESTITNNTFSPGAELDTIDQSLSCSVPQTYKLNQKLYLDSKLIDNCPFPFVGITTTTSDATSSSTTASITSSTTSSTDSTATTSSATTSSSTTSSATSTTSKSTTSSTTTTSTTSSATSTTSKSTTSSTSSTSAPSTSSTSTASPTVTTTTSTTSVPNTVVVILVLRTNATCDTVTTTLATILAQALNINTNQLEIVSCGSSKREVQAESQLNVQFRLYGNSSISANSLQAQVQDLQSSSSFGTLLESYGYTIISTPSSTTTTTTTSSQYTPGNQLSASAKSSPSLILIFSAAFSGICALRNNKTVLAIILLIALFSALPSTQAKTVTWAGGMGRWSNSVLWTPAGVPAYNDTVIIPARSTIYLNSSIEVASLSVSGDTHFYPTEPSLTLKVGVLTFEVASSYYLFYFHGIVVNVTESFTTKCSNFAQYYYFTEGAVLNIDGNATANFTCNVMTITSRYSQREAEYYASEPRNAFINEGSMQVSGRLILAESGFTSTGNITITGVLALSAGADLQAGNIILANNASLDLSVNSNTREPYKFGDQLTLSGNGFVGFTGGDYYYAPGFNCSIQTLILNSGNHFLASHLNVQLLAIGGNWNNNYAPQVIIYRNYSLSYLRFEGYSFTRGVYPNTILSATTVVFNMTNTDDALQFDGLTINPTTTFNITTNINGNTAYLDLGPAGNIIVSEKASGTIGVQGSQSIIKIRPRVTVEGFVGISGFFLNGRVNILSPLASSAPLSFGKSSYVTLNSTLTLTGGSTSLEGTLELISYNSELLLTADSASYGHLYILGALKVVGQGVVTIGGSASVSRYFSGFEYRADRALTFNGGMHDIEANVSLNKFTTGGSPSVPTTVRLFASTTVYSLATSISRLTVIGIGGIQKLYANVTTNVGAAEFVSVDLIIRGNTEFNSVTVAPCASVSIASGTFSHRANLYDVSTFVCPGVPTVNVETGGTLLYKDNVNLGARLNVRGGTVKLNPIIRAGLTGGADFKSGQIIHDGAVLSFASGPAFASNYYFGSNFMVSSNGGSFIFNLGSATVVESPVFNSTFLQITGGSFVLPTNTIFNVTNLNVGSFGVLLTNNSLPSTIDTLSFIGGPVVVVGGGSIQGLKSMKVNKMISNSDTPFEFSSIGMNTQVTTSLNFTLRNDAALTISDSSFALLSGSSATLSANSTVRRTFTLTPPLPAYTFGSFQNNVPIMVNDAVTFDASQGCLQNSGNGFVNVVGSGQFVPSASSSTCSP